MYTIHRKTKEKILKPPLKIIGGKTKYRDVLYDLFPEHDRYIEPFGGSFGVLIGKPKSKEELITDLQPHVINFYECIKYYKQGFYENIKENIDKFTTSDNPRELFLQHRGYLENEKDLLDIFENPFTTVTELNSIAANYYIINKTCMNGIIRFNKKGICNSSYGGTVKGRGFLTEEWFNKIEERLKDVEIRNWDYTKALETAKDSSFTFLDPPYYKVFTSYSSFKFSEDDHIKLRDNLNNLSGKWLMTINYHEDILTMYKDYNIMDNYIFWSCSNTSAGRGLKRELIIKNY